MIVLKPRLKLLLTCGALIAVTLAVYWPVREFDFIDFDDPYYVSKNGRVSGGVTGESIKWALTQAHSSNWHPVTWISHMVDCQLFGLDAGKHHVTNVVLHAANTALLFLLLHGLTGAWGRSALVAALFALHPLHVESVAWISERKDVLSAFFGILTLMAYARFAQGKMQKAKCKNVWYIVALVLFALGLMSKPMLVTWPFVMLLMDFWPLRRIGSEDGRWKMEDGKVWGALVREKIPFFALVVASCVITYVVQASSGAVASLTGLTLEMRINTAIIAYAAYLVKMVWPTNLAVLYLPPERWETELVVLAIAALVGVTLVALWAATKRRYLTVGWFWYLGTLVPVIGLVQVGNQSMADRYTYLPLIGAFIMLVWGGWEIIAPWRRARVIAATITGGVVLTLAGLTTQQVRHWQNSETLFTHTLRVTKDNFIIHNHFGTSLLLQGRYEEAGKQFEAALRIRPFYSDALNNMSVILTQRGELDEAMRYLQEAIRISPKFADTYGKLAVALTAAGRYEEAINCYRKAIDLKLKSVETLNNNLAWILATHPEADYRNGAEAVRLAEQACEMSDYSQTVYIGTLGAAYAEAGRFPEAIATAQRAQSVAQKRGETALAAKNAELEALFRSGQPYREKPLTTLQ